MPNVTKEMLFPEYWARKINCTGILLDSNEIYRLNKEILSTPGTGCSDIKTKKFEVPAIKHMYKNLTDKKLYIRNRPVTKSFFIHAEANLPSLFSACETMFGFCVKHSDIKSLPVAEIVTDDPTEPEMDVFQLSGILPGEPVAILSSTLDQKWFFVESYYYSGWVPAQAIGVCKSKKEWLSLIAEDNFLVITAPNTRIPTTLYPSRLKVVSLPMGSILRIPSEVPKIVDGRYACCCHTALAPSRSLNGSFEEIPVLLPFGDASDEGFLPFTAKNVLTQAFKYLGAPYGWGGMLERTDCSQLLMQVFRCFGLMLPRDTQNQFFMPLERIELFSDTPDMKARVINTLPPASILRFKGHTMLYLGTENGLMYVISNLYSAIPEGETKPVRVKSVVVNDLTIKRPSGHTWLEDIDTAFLLKT